MDRRSNLDTPPYARRPSTAPINVDAPPPSLFHTWAYTQPTKQRPNTSGAARPSTPRSQQAMLASQQLQSLSPSTSEVNSPQPWSLPARPSTSPAPLHRTHSPSPTASRLKGALPHFQPPSPTSPTRPHASPLKPTSSLHTPTASPKLHPPPHDAYTTPRTLPPPTPSCTTQPASRRSQTRISWSDLGDLPQWPPATSISEPSRPSSTAGTEARATATCSTGVQSAPAPWTRYFFPDDLNSCSPRPGTPFYQYFDVRSEACPTVGAVGAMPCPLPPPPPAHLQQHAPPPPAWVEEAYQKLTLVNMDSQRSRPHPTATDAVCGGAALVTSAGLAQHWQDVSTWASSVGCLRPRSWADAEALAKLQGGVIHYLLQQLHAAPAAAAADVQQQCERRLEERTRAAEAAADQRVADEAARLKAEAAASLQVLRKQAGREAGEELGSILLRHQKEIECLQKQLTRAQGILEQHDSVVAAAEAINAELRAQVQQLADENQQQREAAAAQEASFQAQVERLELTVSGAKSAVLDAIRAQDMEGVWPLATSAVHHLTSALCAYCATFEPADAEEAAAMRASQTGLGPYKSPRHSIHNGLGGQLSGARVSCTGVRLAARASVAGGGADASHDSAEKGLVLRYVAASSGLEFMLGQELPPGSGVCWKLLSGAPEIDLPEAHTDPSVRWLRTGVHEHLQGSYFAVPVLDMKGIVVAVVAADTCAPGGEGQPFTEEDKAIIREVAAAVQHALSAQDRLMLQLLQEHPSTSDLGADDQDGEAQMLEEMEEHADLLGGRTLLREAFSQLTTLTEADILQLVELPDSGATAWAVVKGAVGLLLPPIPTWDWGTLRELVTPTLLQAAAEYDIDAAEWRHVRVMMAEVLNMPAFSLLSEGRAVSALYCWLTAVKKLSAHAGATAALQERLAVANSIVSKAVGDPKSAALRELKAFRAPPTSTLHLLRAALQLIGHPPQVYNAPWSQCRAQVNQELARRMGLQRPALMGQSSLATVQAVLKKVPETAVAKECTAGVLLHAWLRAVLAILASPTHAMNRKARPPSALATLSNLQAGGGAATAKE